MNGRLYAEKINGTFTYESSQGASLIDMLLACEGDFSLITDFQVNPFTEFSDHASISFSLCCKRPSVLACEQNKDRKFSWNPSQRTTFRNRLIALLPTFNSITSNINRCSRSSNNDNVNKFSDTLTEVAFPLFSKRQKQMGTRFSEKVICQDSEWFDKQCAAAKRAFISARNHYHHNKSTDNRQKFLKLKTQYKKLCRSKRNAFRKKKMIEMENLKSSKPKEFWRYFKNHDFCNNNIHIDEFAKCFADITYYVFKFQNERS